MKQQMAISRKNMTLLYLIHVMVFILRANIPNMDFLEELKLTNEAKHITEMETNRTVLDCSLFSLHHAKAPIHHSSVISTLNLAVNVHIFRLRNSMYLALLSFLNVPPLAPRARPRVVAQPITGDLTHAQPIIDDVTNPRARSRVVVQPITGDLTHAQPIVDDVTNPRARSRAVVQPITGDLTHAQPITGDVTNPRARSRVVVQPITGDLTHA